MAAPIGLSLRTLPRQPLREFTATKTRLAVVIVNFCQWNNTARLVKQLRRSDAIRGDDARIILVDNASPPHALAERLEKSRSVKLLRNDANLGFAKAVNRGVVAAGSDWILLLNPDITVEEGFLDQVAALLDEFPEDAGVVGFQLRDPDSSPQASAGKFPTLNSTIAGLIRPRARRKCRHQSVDSSGPVDWVTGGCLLVRRECFQALGGFDERFFLYYEDVDFCRRAARQGWRVLYEPRLAVTHHWPLHRREVPPSLRLITRHALLMYAKTHWSVGSARLLARLVGLEARMRQMAAQFRGDVESAATYHNLRTLIRHIRWDRRDAMAAAIRQAARSLELAAAPQDSDCA